MLIDKVGTGSGASIALYPRSYNKRGDERLHSVQGVTLDGREVNIKLRVDEAMQGKENTPSIAEFAREDVKAKNPCLATPDNGPGAREGVLLFTGCEEDGENRKGILSFTARWGYVLASHSDAPEPVFGLGRVVMIADSHAAKTIHAEITELERTKVDGWEAIAEHKRKALSDPMLFSYYGQLYIQDEEVEFDPKDRDGLVDFAREAFARHTKNGVVGGLLIRTRDLGGEISAEFSPEIFPRWKPGNTYQSAEDVLGYFFRANAKNLSTELCSKVMVMPVKRYSCGPSFKNYYFLKKPEDSLLKLRKRFLINNEPTVSEIAFALSRREDSGESFMLKYYPISNPISSVADIGKSIAIKSNSGANQVDPVLIEHSTRVPVGLSTSGHLLLPSWYAIGSLSGLDGLHATPTENDQAQAAPGDLTGSELEVEPDNAAVSKVIVVEQNPVADAKENSEVSGTNTPREEHDSAQSATDSGSDGDLSDLFSGITDEELAEIEEQQRLALEERAKADLLLAQLEVEQEALERQETDNESRHAETQVTGGDSPVEIHQPGKSPAADAALMMLVDDSAEVDGVDAITPTPPQPAPVPNQDVSSSGDRVPENDELSGLERMAKMRGLL